MKTNWLERHLGETIVTTGVIHSLTGIVGGRPVIADLWRDGVVNSVGTNGKREAWLWFATTGGILVGAGLLADSHLRRTGTLPPSFGATLLATALANGMLQPVSGAWLVAAEGLLALKIGSQRPIAADAA